MRGAWEKNPPWPLKTPFQELKSTSPRVFTTGSSQSAERTIESRFCTLWAENKNIKAFSRRITNANSTWVWDTASGICSRKLNAGKQTTEEAPNASNYAWLFNRAHMHTYISMYSFIYLCFLSGSISIHFGIQSIQSFVNKLHEIVFSGFCFHILWAFLCVASNIKIMCELMSSKSANGRRPTLRMSNAISKSRRVPGLSTHSGKLNIKNMPNTRKKSKDR